MASRRRRGESAWKEWALSALLGVGLALVVLLWLSRRWDSPQLPPPTAPPAPESAGETGGDRGIGIEFSFRFRLLLPEERKTN